MSLTIITNNNIKDLIRYYLTDKPSLPDDLKNVLIGSWDVSNVTDLGHVFHVRTNSEAFVREAYENFNESIENWDTSNVTYMGFMLAGCKRFNQPLNNLNVSRVEIMRGMFYDCENFNQPLNNWNTSRVIDMEAMFVNCRYFNQNLSGWDVSNVTEIREIFINCGISEENKPHFINTVEVEVDAQQIHRETAKINFEKLNTFLSSLLNITVPTEINFPHFIYDNIASFINQSNNTEENKEKQLDELEGIMEERLGYLNYGEFSELLLVSIFYVLEYVNLQPNEFKEIYANTFIQDCVHAYDGEDGMTCAAGAVERIVMSLLPACTTDENNANYKTLIDIIAANPNKLIPEYIKDWYKLHKTGTPGAFPPGTTKEEKKNDLRNYLLEKFPEETTLINDKIAGIADNIGYDDDDFMYGGKRNRKKNKKSKKRISRTSGKKTKKNVQKTNKVKKTQKAKRVQKTKKIMKNRKMKLTKKRKNNKKK